MGDASAELQRARLAYGAHQWTTAGEAFLAARAAHPLDASDTGALADCLWWTGDVDGCLAASEEAYRLHLGGASPDPGAAAMMALDIGFTWLLRGEESLGSGWLSRAQRLLEDQPPALEHGYLRILEIEGAMAMGELDRAVSVAREVAALADQHGDETLLAVALVGEGIARIRQGRVSDGLAVLDEAMLPVVAGRVRPTFAGNVYCQLMSVCHEIADIRRAEQWTGATQRWCEGFDRAVMFIGVCRVHRAQLLQIHGEWDRAEDEVTRVCDELAAMNVQAIGLALYERAEIRRFRGELERAEATYAEAERHGVDPQPGLALLWLAAGRTAAAGDAIATACELASDRLARTRLLPAAVEVAVAAGDLTAAQRSADELDAAASTFATPGLLAEAAHARGRLRRAAGDPVAAADCFREACRRWRELRAPYRAAVAGRDLAGALRACGDEQSALLQEGLADDALRALGAVAPPPAPGPPQAAELPAGITRREAEVLGLVAAGLSNREVAEALVLSDKTVARHLANLFVKLGVSSRTAAAAFAHAHGLVGAASAPFDPSPVDDSA